MKTASNLRNTILIFAVLALGGSLLLHTYFYGATDSLVAKALDTRSFLSSTQAARIQGKETMKLFDSTAERRARLAAFFVPAENAVPVIQAIESIGNVSGATVDITSIQSVPATPDKIGQVSALVVVKGSWKSVMQALELFETIQYQKTINNLKLILIDRATDKDKSNHWEADFDISFPTITRS